MDRRILVIEDEDLLAMLLVDELENYGFDANRVSNGYDAIESLKNETYHGIVTDLYMPTMDGLQFLDAINAKELTIPIVVVTGSNTREVNLKLEQLGVKNIFHKPLDLDDLVQIVQLLER